MTTDALDVHFVWLGSRLPYHGRLAIESALVAMPGADVHLHLLDRRTCGTHLDAVTAHRGVTVEHHTPSSLFRAAPGGAGRFVDVWRRVPPSSPAARSNLARLAILHERGGVYLDTDVIVLRDLHRPDVHGSYVGRERVWALNRKRVATGLDARDCVASIPWATAAAVTWLDSRLAHGRWATADHLAPRGAYELQVNNAVIGAPAGSTFVAMALERALGVDPTVRFALGPSLLDDVAREHPDVVHLVPPSRFYAVPPGQSHRFFDDHRLDLPADAQVMHYVASNHRRLLDRLDVDDPRFATGRGVFWRHGDRVRTAIGGLSDRPSGSEPVPAAVSAPASRVIGSIP